MGNNSNIFNILLNEKEKTILNIYEFLCKEIFNKNFNLNQNNSIYFLLKYLRSKNEKFLSTLWSNISLQRELFLLIIDFCDYFNLKSTIKDEDIIEFFNKKQEKFLLSKLLIKYVDELKKLYCTKTLNSNLKIIFKEKNFEFYYLKYGNEDITDLDSSDIFFHIILDGVVEINKKDILSRGDVYFSRILPLKEKFTPLTPNYSKIIFVIKSEFLKTSNIKILKSQNQKFYLPIIKLIENILINTPSNKINNFILLQVATYLIEFYNNGCVKLYEIPYLNYKKTIVNIIKNNIFLERKSIVNELLKSLDISLSKLYTIFYYLFDMPINKYIDKLKIDKACYLLISTNYSITYISMELNISEQALINKFTKHLACTPNKFREKMREK